MNGIGKAILASAAATSIAACSTAAPPPPPAITVSQSEISATPPPAVSTPVPVVRAKLVPGAGRPDPFVALFGPPTTVSPKPKTVASSSFPKIPTLPGFEAGPGGTMHSVWDGVSLTGIVASGGYTAILSVDSKSYIVRQGDDVGSRFRVAAIGPDSVTLVTTASPVAQRTFSLGG